MMTKKTKKNLFPFKQGRINLQNVDSALFSFELSAAQQSK